MRKLYIICVSCFSMLISGCVNVYNYRYDQQILASFSTSRDPQKTQECILASWQREYLGYGVSGQRVENYYSVLAGVDNVDVFAENNETRVNFYSLRGALDPWKGIPKRIAAIKTCL